MILKEINWIKHLKKFVFSGRSTCDFKVTIMSSTNNLRQDLCFNFKIYVDEPRPGQRWIPHGIDQSIPSGIGSYCRN